MNIATTGAPGITYPGAAAAGSARPAALRAVVRRADRVPYVRGALAAGTLVPGPASRFPREPFETDGPATCLI